MNSRFLHKFALALSLACPALGSAAAAQTWALQGVSSSSIAVLGDSTLHTWKANAMSLSFSATVKAGAGPLVAQVLHGALEALTVTVWVDSLKSTESSGMDKNMHRAMDSDKFPQISFVIKSYQVKDSDVTAQGSLSIHGVSKDVELSGKLTAADGGLGVKGSYDLLMSDYGIKPPVMMLGTVRVKDKVSIAYDYQLATESRP